MENLSEMKHGIIAEERTNISISGVKEVIAFDSDTLYLDTVMGRLSVKGDNLHIVSFHAETGDLTAEGTINGFVYTGEIEHAGLFSRIFR